MDCWKYGLLDLKKIKKGKLQAITLTDGVIVVSGTTEMYLDFVLNINNSLNKSSL